jgi:hypothetical protein
MEESSMTKLQMLRELDRCFQIALEGGLTAAEKNSLDTRFYEFLLILQEAETPKTKNQQVLEKMKWTNL